MTREAQAGAEGAKVKPPSVLHLVISLAHGGLERLVVDWVNARNRRWPGSTCAACLDAEAGELGAELEGAPAICLGARRGRFPWDRQAVRQLRQVLQSGFDVIHSHNLAAQQYAALAAGRGGVRHVHTEHGTNPHCRGIVNRLRSRWLAARSDALVAVSRDTARKMAPLWGRSADAITVVVNGIAPAPDCSPIVRRALRESLGLPHSAFVVGSAGRLARVKGYDRLLAAFAAAASSAPNARLVLIGDGPERAALEGQARGLGIGGATIFTGYRNDARRLIETLDLFVLPSRSEGLPVALLEAMAAGVPAMAAEVGDVGEVLDGGRAGTLLPPSDGQWAALLAEAIRAGAGQRQEQAQRARARVTERYSQASMLESYERLYRDALRGTA